MKIKTTTLILILISAPECFSQGENDNWIFGEGAHLTFRNGTAQVLYSGHQVKTLEGSTSVSNPKGDLLFYSDGSAIYNRHYKQMPNGNKLMGHKSSTSSAVAVPYPGDPLKYFLFCVDHNQSARNMGLTYNLVDITLDYGNGDLSIKNQVLVKNTDEKIAVGKQCNGVDYWVVVHKAFSDSFLSYSITSAGLNPVPVLSLISSPKDKTRPELGYLKFSPSGNYLVNAGTQYERLEIFRFDKKTGRLTEYALDDTKYHTATKPETQTYYGVAFSASENFMYVSTLEKGEMFQYDMLLSPGMIMKRRKKIGQLDKCAGALQLGKDKRIYASDGYNSNYLHVISEPDKYSCELNKHAIQFNYGVICNLGLPTLIETSINYFSLGNDIILQSSSIFKLDAKIMGGKYRWSTGDTTRSIRISDTGGVYWVNVFDPGSCMFYTDTITVHVFKEFVSDNLELKDKVFCSNTLTSIIPFRSTIAGIRYIWVNDNRRIGLPESGSGDIPVFRTASLSYAESAIIKVYPVKDGFVGKPFEFAIFIKPMPVLKSYHLSDFEMCAGKKFEGWYFNAANTGFKWFNNNTATGIPDSGNTIIPAFVSSAISSEQVSKITVYLVQNSCLSYPGYMKFTVYPIPKINKLKDIELCYGQEIPLMDFNSDVINSRILIKIKAPYPYKEIKTDYLKTFKIPDSAGLFSRKIIVYPEYKTCFGRPDSFFLNIKPNPKASFEIVSDPLDTGFFNTNVSFVNKSSKFTDFYWSFNGTIDSVNFSPQVQVRSNKTWDVGLELKNNFGCSDQMNRKFTQHRLPQVFMPNAFSPNSDAHNEKLAYKLRGIKSHELRIYDRWGYCIFISTDALSFWDGKIESEDASDGTYLWVITGTDIMNKPVNFKGTLSLCR